jgi:hypothetical protein
MTNRAYQPSDEELLDSVPEFFSSGTLAKALPATDGGRRLIWLEASNEDVDHTGEIVLQKALADTADYYLRHGNIDLHHYTVIGAKGGIPNALEYEIGRPLEVQRRGKTTFVKAELYQGESAMAKNADLVWDSLTRQTPPARWYASVGGAVLSKKIARDPATGQKVAVIDRVRWNNIALDRTPANRTVGTVSTAPIGVFAKSLGGFVITKALEAGNQVSPEGLVGGGALRAQSLDRQLQQLAYPDLRERLAGAIRSQSVAPTPGALTAHLRDTFGLPADKAAEMVERFLADLRNGRRRKPRTQTR